MRSKLVRDLLDAWISDHPDPKLTRPEAIRQLIHEHLNAKGYLKADGAG